MKEVYGFLKIQFLYFVLTEDYLINEKIKRKVSNRGFEVIKKAIEKIG